MLLGSKLTGSTCVSLLCKLHTTSFAYLAFVLCELENAVPIARCAANHAALFRNRHETVAHSTARRALKCGQSILVTSFIISYPCTSVDCLESSAMRDVQP